MSEYGIQILNEDGQTVIDSRQNYSLLYAGPSYNMTGPNSNPTFPTTGWTGSGLILARPQSTLGLQTIGRGFSGWAQIQAGGANTTWRELRAQRDDSLSPSGYGLVVYDDTGTDVLFSATDLETTAELVASGQFNGSTGSFSTGWYHEFDMDPNLDKGRYYVLATNTNTLYGVKPAWQVHVDYKFDYGNSKIYVQNFFWSTEQGFSSYVRQNLSTDYAIFYVRNGGSADDNFA